MNKSYFLDPKKFLVNVNATTGFSVNLIRFFFNPFLHIAIVQEFIKKETETRRKKSKGKNIHVEKD